MIDRNVQVFNREEESSPACVCVCVLGLSGGACREGPQALTGEIVCISCFPVLLFYFNGFVVTSLSSPFFMPCFLSSFSLLLPLCVLKSLSIDLFPPFLFP